jgi:Zn-dependent peptidase ImmA (M78 family)
MQAGFRNGQADCINVFLNKSRPVNRRFALSRLIGDHLITANNERLLPLTRMITGRQKFQKAFAQELLCPFMELKEFLGDSPPNNEIIEDAAYHFEVSPLVIGTALVNKKLLDRAYLVD